MSDGSALESFYRWMDERGVRISDQIEIRPAPDSRYGVFCKAGEIKPETLLLQVPKDSIICAANVFPIEVRNSMDALGAEGMIAVCMALMYERTLGKDSRFAPYLAMIPKSENQPQYWSDQSEKDLFKGTEVELSKGTSDDVIRRYYEKFILPILHSHRDFFGDLGQYPYETYAKTLSVVLSRVFEIDVYRHLALVPFADMFDHSNSEHVDFVTNYYVCQTCGAWQYCEHDRIDDLKLLFPEICRDGEMCELYLTRKVSEGEQLYNNYGKLGNDVLISRYGFALPDNCHTRVHLSSDMVISGDQLERRKLWSHLGRMLAIEVCSMLGVDFDEEYGETEKHVFHVKHLTLTQEGVSSIPLALYLYFQSIGAHKYQTLTPAQIYRDCVLTEFSDAAKFLTEMSNTVGEADSQAIVLACNLLMKTCRNRLSKYEKTVVLEEPPSTSRTRMAYTTARQEIDILGYAINKSASLINRVQV